MVNADNTDDTAGTVPTGHVFRHRPYTDAEIQRGRDAALDAWDAHRAAIAWAMDRALDPEPPEGTDPAPWADVSGPLTVTEAATVLRNMRRAR